MWEYRRLDFSYKTITDLEEKLQKLGDENWDIIVYTEIPQEKYDRSQRIKILGKRPKKETA
jgi:hypothetical protein